MLSGRVVKGGAAQYSVDVDGKILRCTARGKIKLDGEILIGDFVEIETDGVAPVIKRILTRRNTLVRPYVSNIDVCFIVIAEVPKPDFMLVDKIIINCRLSDITPILVVNKEDISSETFIGRVKRDYDGVLKTIICSAKNGAGIDGLIAETNGKVACLAGQSAVGKSSILNSVLNTDKFKTGGLSAKTERGKHTTRQSAIEKANGGYFIDTCGFSMLDLPENLKPDDLRGYYFEFDDYVENCKFRNGCLHIGEPDCAVKKAVGKGDISPDRYARYVELYNELKNKRRNKYD